MRFITAKLKLEIAESHKMLQRVLEYLYTEVQNFDSPTYIRVTCVKRTRRRQIEIYAGVKDPKTKIIKSGTGVVNPKTNQIYKRSEVPYSTHSAKPCRASDLTLVSPRVTRVLDPQYIALENAINKRFIYDPKRAKKKCCIFHDIGLGRHLHIQVHYNTFEVAKATVKKPVEKIALAEFIETKLKCIEFELTAIRQVLEECR